MPSAARALHSVDGVRPFRDLGRCDGYLPIENHALIGDCSTAALVGTDGAVNWLCVPRFDSEPLFAGLIDKERGGRFTVAPLDAIAARRRYVDETAVLETEIRGKRGVVRLTDGLTLHAGADLREDVHHARGELLRYVECLEGDVDLLVEVNPRGGATAEPLGSGLRLRCERRPELDLHLCASTRLDGLRSVLRLRSRDRLRLSLRWAGGMRRLRGDDGGFPFTNTLEAWRRWMRCVDYGGPEQSLVRRSALTLKLLDHSGNGAMVAAPTSSLPEEIGGRRNWDYRFTWIRDAAFSAYAFRRVGMREEGARFLDWVLEVAETAARPKVLYTIDGRVPAAEREDEELEGYCGSRPVRWGNAAVEQRQHDVYGELLDCVYQWAGHERAPEPHLWAHIRRFLAAALDEWRQPDHGIWEVRTSGRPFTYSAALCQVALDRGARLARRFALPGEPDMWARAAAMIQDTILREAWDEKRSTLVEHLGGGGLDASLLALPLRRVIRADHPKMIATTRAIERRLDAGGGLLYRYLPRESPDGVRGEDGAFLLCSFWLVDNLAKRGELERASDLFASLCSRAGDLGLLPEEIDPTTGAFLGNYPQALSHVGVVSSGICLQRAIEEARRA